MPPEDKRIQTARLLRRNSIYILLLGAAGILLGSLVFDRPALTEAGVLTAGIGALILAASIVLSITTPAATSTR